jgi:hypothetical protein
MQLWCSSEAKLTNGFNCGQFQLGTNLQISAGLSPHKYDGHQVVHVHPADNVACIALYSSCMTAQPTGFWIHAFAVVAGQQPQAECVTHV